jgi:hypothetical protein
MWFSVEAVVTTGDKAKAEAFLLEYACSGGIFRLGAEGEVSSAKYGLMFIKDASWSGGRSMIDWAKCGLFLGGKLSTNSCVIGLSGSIEVAGTPFASKYAGPGPL